MSPLITATTWEAKLLVAAMLLGAHGAAAGAEVAAPPSNAAWRRASTAAGRRVVGVHSCGWAPNWHAEGGHQHYRWNMLSEVSASGYVALLPNGSAPFAICGKPTGFQQTEYPAMRALARQHGVRWTFNVSPAKDFTTTASMDAFLNDSVARAAAVASLVAVLHAEEADGLMLDFEGTYEWSPIVVPRLLGWFAELRAGLTANGLHNATLSLPQGQYKPSYTAFRPHITQLLSIFDTIFVMAYDNGNYVGPAPGVGPNSPLTGGQQIGDWAGNIEFFVNDSLSIGVPGRQLVIGVPFYGRQYPTFGQSDSGADRQLRMVGASNAGVNGTTPDIKSRTIGYPLSLSEHEAAASTNCGTSSADYLFKSCSPGGMRWDETTQTPWYSFLDDFGMAGQGFFDNERSILLKYEYIASVPDLGLGLFAIDYPLMDDRLWDNLGNFSRLVNVAQSRSA